MNITPDSLQFLNELRDAINANAVEKGFVDKIFEGLTQEQIDGPIGQRLRASVYITNEHGELSEFWEAYRAGTLDELCDKSDKMRAAGLEPLTCAEEEIADSLIRTLDRARAFSVNAAKAVAIKHAFNRTRPALHGGKRA